MYSPKDMTGETKIILIDKAGKTKKHGKQTSFRKETTNVFSGLQPLHHKQELQFYPYQTMLCICICLHLGKNAEYHHR